MGAVKKFGKKAVVNQLRHVTREIKYPKNTFQEVFNCCIIIPPTPIKTL